MPTYRNTGVTQVYWRNKLWEPGESLALDFYVPHADLGLTLTASTPTVSPPVLLSEDITLVAGVAQDKAIPYAPRIIVSAYAMTGTATLSIGTKEITLDAESVYTSTVLPWDKVASLKLESTAGATVRLLVEGVL